MKVAEKINYLLKEQNLTKREFAKKLLELEPKLDSTGKQPSESTVYGYLNGGREIKVELIPYIAEVLGVSEQELFSFDIEYACEYNHRHSKEVREIIHLLQYAPKGAIENIRNYLSKYQTLQDTTL
jgi:transcriptional regulator with XRE-family HTH domain